MSSEKLKCAVIGLGMGKNHVASYLKNDRAELVAAVDIDASQFDRIDDLAPDVRRFSDHKEMLAECKPDVVSVVLPNFLHEPVSADCMEAGADVLCEKPMSNDLDGALRMAKAAEKSGRTIYMNLSQRFGAANVQTRKLIDEGVLGEVYHAAAEWTRRAGIPGFGGWFGQKDLSGGGPMIDIGVHRIDLALWLMGGPKPVTVSGATHHQHGVPKARKTGAKFDVEDYASGLIRFENGASLLFEISWAGHQVQQQRQALKLVGTEGGIEVGWSSSEWLPILSHEIGGIPVTTTVRDPGNTAPYSCEVLVDCILDGKPFPATMADGLRMQVILEALYVSAERGREVDIKAEFPDAFGLL